MGRHNTLPTPWSTLVAKIGSVHATAQQLGASTRTIHNWAHRRTTPEGPSQKIIEAVFRGHGLAEPTLGAIKEPRT